MENTEYFLRPLEFGNGFNITNSDNDFSLDEGGINLKLYSTYQQGAAVTWDNNDAYIATVIDDEGAGNQAGMNFKAQDFKFLINQNIDTGTDLKTGMALNRVQIDNDESIEIARFTERTSGLLIISATGTRQVEALSFESPADNNTPVEVFSTTSGYYETLILTITGTSPSDTAGTDGAVTIIFNDYPSGPNKIWLNNRTGNQASFTFQYLT